MSSARAHTCFILDTSAKELIFFICESTQLWSCRFPPFFKKKIFINVTESKEIGS